MNQKVEGADRTGEIGLESGLEALRQSPAFHGPVEPFDDHEHSNDHLALVYENRDEQFAAVSPFVRQGLERVEQSDGEFEPVDCDAVFERVVDDLRVQIEDNDAEVVADSLPTVTADAEQLEQLFRNLVSNGIKYSSDDPARVEVTAEQRADCWEFSVADNGIGIDPEKTDRIFEVFKRLHHDDEYSGTGIGLSLCQEIVENHGGDIWVDSEPGDGSTFSFTLPSRAAE